MKWMEHHKGALVDRGAPVGKTKACRLKGSQGSSHDVGGYSIVQADLADAAAKMFGKDQPHLQMPGTWIEITEILEMPGM